MFRENTQNNEVDTATDIVSQNVDNMNSCVSDVRSSAAAVDNALDSKDKKLIERSLKELFGKFSIVDTMSLDCTGNNSRYLTNFLAHARSDSTKILQDAVIKVVDAGHIDAAISSKALKAALRADTLQEPEGFFAKILNSAIKSGSAKQMNALLSEKSFTEKVKEFGNLRSGLIISDIVVPNYDINNKDAQNNAAFALINNHFIRNIFSDENSNSNLSKILADTDPARSTNRQKMKSILQAEAKIGI